MCVIDIAGVYRRSQSKPALTDFGPQPYRTSLPFNGLHPRNYMDYYLFTDPVGMEGFVTYLIVQWSQN